jgi:hypothetical protein
MPAHKIAYYKDGFFKVEYCKLCGYEGVDLICDCPGKFEKKRVDSKEQNSILDNY